MFGISEENYLAHANKNIEQLSAFADAKLDCISARRGEVYFDFHSPDAIGKLETLAHQRGALAKDLPPDHLAPANEVIERITTTAGFSLVELSIVLVILGLLTGGILAGQSLIRVAELRSVGAQYNQFVAATQSFRDKYLSIPGDMTNATSFWGKDAAACNGDAGTTGSPGTCNGNGNGIYGNGAANGATAETYQYWKQLVLAGLVEGSFSGLAGVPGSGPSVGVFSVVGTNVPASRIGARVGWSVYNRSASGNGSYFDNPGINMYILGAQDNDEPTYISALRPEELWNVDSKFDDGRPAVGKLWSINWGTCTTASSSSDTAAEYRLTSSAIACAAQWNTPF